MHRPSMAAPAQGVYYRGPVHTYPYTLSQQRWCTTTMQAARLTTLDNPYDPFDSFYQWYEWDETHGYHTTSYLGRVAWTSDELSEADEVLATNQAIDEIIELDLTGNYKKVESRES